MGSKLAERLRKDAPKFGLEEFDPTFDLRQEAATALDACERALKDARDILWEDSAIGTTAADFAKRPYIVAIDEALAKLEAAR